MLSVSTELRESFSYLGILLTYLLTLLIVLLYGSPCSRSEKLLYRLYTYVHTGSCSMRTHTAVTLLTVMMENAQPARRASSSSPRPATKEDRCVCTSWKTTGSR